MKKWYTYIIECENGLLYTGVTANVNRRFKEHGEGRGGRFTSLNKPKKVVYTEIFDDKIEALKREKQFKGWSRKKKTNFIKSNLTG